MLPVITPPQNPSPTLFLSCGIPFIITSNGTMSATTGVLSAIAALPTAYPNAFVYCGANTITASNAAGWYYAVFSSTTSCTLYNNTYTAGSAPTVPASPTAFTTSVSGAFTTAATGSNIAGISFTIPGGSMGNNGRIRMERCYSYGANNANSKTYSVSLGATQFCSYNATASTQGRDLPTIWNCGSQSVNAGSANSNFNSSTTQYIRGTIATSANQTLTFNQYISAGNGATDWCVSEYVNIEIIYGA